MKNSLLFDLSVNRTEKSIVIKREFSATLSLVWDAWTKPELLDQWWAPKPYKVKTKSFDFQEGGSWLYAMISPENEAHWCKADYQKINPKTQLDWLDAFCDENGQENAQMPRSLWKILFTEKDDVTLVNITLKHEKLEDMETLIKMGFNEGFTMGLNNLEELLNAKAK